MRRAIMCHVVPALSFRNPMPRGVALRLGQQRLHVLWTSEAGKSEGRFEDAVLGRVATASSVQLKSVDAVDIAA